jgi:integrase
VSELAIPADAGWTEADFTVSDETLLDLEAARSDNTRAAYRRNWADWTEWCLAEGRVALPATPHTLLEYVRARKTGAWYPLRVEAARRRPPSPATLKQVVATIQSAHRKAGHKGQPDTENVREFLQGYGREWADAGNRVRRAAPLNPEQMRLLAVTCDIRTLAGLRDRSLLLVGYAIGRRASTLAGLRVADIRSAGQNGLTVYIKYSKTDQAGNGEEVNVPWGQHPETCAVTATRAWLAALRDRGITSGPLYQKVDSKGRPGCDPGAIGGRSASGHLGRHHITSIIRRHHRLAGLDDPEFISGHSLRAGAVTSAHAAGASSLAIAEQYGFSPRSNTMQTTYFRSADRIKNNPAKLTGL